MTTALAAEEGNRRANARLFHGWYRFDLIAKFISGVDRHLINFYDLNLSISNGTHAAPVEKLDDS